MIPRDEQYCRCNVGQFLAKYADIIYPLIVIESRMTPFDLYKADQTRCFTTAFVLLSLYTTIEKTVEIIDHCFTVSIRGTNKTNIQDIIKEINDITRNHNMMKKGEIQTKMIYFVNINAFLCYHRDNLNVQKYFPGHVFLIEQIPDLTNNTVIYHIYQSYVNKYSYTTEIEMQRMNNKYNLEYEDIKDIFDTLEKLFRIESEGVCQEWGYKHTEQWEKLTHINLGKEYDGYCIEDIRFCGYTTLINDYKCHTNVAQLLQKLKFRLNPIPEDIFTELYEYIIGRVRIKEETENAYINSVYLNAGIPNKKLLEMLNVMIKEWETLCK